MSHTLHGQMRLSDVRTWHVDIDRFINPWVPAPRLHILPRPISHFLGYRDKPARPLGNVVLAFWSLVGAFCGVALIAEVSKRIPAFEVRDAPAVVGSFGAAAVIEFCAIESPFAQPRNAFFSQMWACLMGIGISKLFALSPHAQQYTELGGALACGLTTAAMLLTGTIHPPAGATALLAVTNEQMAGLGWFLFPVMMLGVVLMQVVALIVNNIQRQYPLYWWTSHPLARRQIQDEEKENIHRKAGSDVPSHYEESLTDVPRRIVLERGEIFVPDGVFLSAEEREVLEKISDRI
ncbi:uncharacterized protein N7496_004189 [Penicillium cataractarum]|uniref:HPP transmembrane region domain-containing protein n=1 Tax=Penicillium cataractarum TaxID=2100454 RepID=A0A9W9VJJ5_9EURO|nr:uncharacterized protein N7496_004189 [Penicillium cataractarum]KAJ5381761.1 hypothetical protein N7496_004189 [Penicillium cataractarum]